MIGLVTALSLALIAAPDPGGLPVAPAPQTDAQILAALRESLAAADHEGVVAALATGFPADYAILEQEMLARARAGTLDPAGAEAMAATFSSTLMARHMDRVTTADTEHLLALSMQRLALMTALQNSHAAACHEFVEAGLSAERVSELGLEPAHVLSQLTRVVISIVARPPQGVLHPEPATEAWEVIGRRYAALGGDPAWITALFGNQDYTGQTHVGRCDSAVQWETAVSEAAPEIRAYYVSALYSARPVQPVMPVS